MTGGADADTFVFGHNVDADGDGECNLGESYDEYWNPVPPVDFAKPLHGDDIITDFNKMNGDLIQIHSGLDITDVSLNGVDMIITTTGGTITIENAVNTISGLDPTDPDFDGSSEALEKFILDYNPENGEGKGFVVIEDKCITPPDINPMAPDTYWQRGVEVPGPSHKPLDGVFGDTTINIDAQTMADRFMDEDENISVEDGYVYFNALNEGGMSY